MMLFIAMFLFGHIVTFADSVPAFPTLRGLLRANRCEGPMGVPETPARPESLFGMVTDTGSLDPWNTYTHANAQDVNSMEMAGRETDSYADITVKYAGKVLRYDFLMQNNATCSVFLCGTLHVTNTSVAMVEDLCSGLRPDAVLLELCAERVDDILYCELASKRPISFIEAVSEGFRRRSLQEAVLGVVTWVQERMSSALGASMGSEQAAAFRYAKKHRIPTVLGDRRHSITAQRIFDRMTTREKIASLFALCWDIVTWPFVNSTDYIRRSENDDEFLKQEINQFTRSNKGLAEVLIAERDEYIAQSIIELIKLLDLKSSYSNIDSSDGTSIRDDTIWPQCNKGVKVLAVMGLGHLHNVYRQICSGGASQARMLNISASSKCQEPTWPGEMHLHVVDCT